MCARVCVSALCSKAVIDICVATPSVTLLVSLVRVGTAFPDRVAREEPCMKQSQSAAGETTTTSGRRKKGHKKNRFQFLNPKLFYRGFRGGTLISRRNYSAKFPWKAFWNPLICTSIEMSFYDFPTRCICLGFNTERAPQGSKIKNVWGGNLAVFFQDLFWNVKEFSPDVFVFNLCFRYIWIFLGEMPFSGFCSENLPKKGPSFFFNSLDTSCILGNMMETELQIGRRYFDFVPLKVWIPNDSTRNAFIENTPNNGFNTRLFDIVLEVYVIFCTVLYYGNVTNLR